jgi:hypothetical protein
MQVYYIVNWPYHEHRDAKVPRRVRWVKAKCDFDGDAWRLLMKHPHAADALATWEIVRGLAALSPFRGLILTDAGTPTPRDLADIADRTRADLGMITRGMSVLVDVLGWVSIANLDSHPASLSRSLWKQVFTVGGDSNAGFVRKKRAYINSNTTSPSHSPSPVINSPLPPSGSEAKQPPTGDSTDDGNGGELEREPGEGEPVNTATDNGNATASLAEQWANGTWPAILKELDPAWVPYVQKLLPKLARYEPRIVLGHILDIRNAERRPQNARQVEAFLMWRLDEGKDPSAPAYRRAKRILDS